MSHRDSSTVSPEISLVRPPRPSFLFFFNDTATTEIYTLSLHDALPILNAVPVFPRSAPAATSLSRHRRAWDGDEDRKSTRLNSSHGYISYAVFCLKKKKTRTTSSCSPRARRLLTHALADRCWITACASH